jgi:hypothetical protein
MSQNPRSAYAFMISLINDYGSFTILDYATENYFPSGSEFIE